jgi:hypothetical protein
LNEPGGESEFEGAQKGIQTDHDHFVIAARADVGPRKKDDLPIRQRAGWHSRSAALRGTTFHHQGPSVETSVRKAIKTPNGVEHFGGMEADGFDVGQLVRMMITSRKPHPLLRTQCGALPAPLACPNLESALAKECASCKSILQWRVRTFVGLALPERNSPPWISKAGSLQESLLRSCCPAGVGSD